MHPAAGADWRSAPVRAAGFATQRHAGERRADGCILIRLDDLLAQGATPAVDTRRGTIGRDTIVRYALTSGSTGHLRRW